MEIKVPEHFTKKTLISQEEAEAMANKIAELEEENCKLRERKDAPDAIKVLQRVSKKDCAIAAMVGNNHSVTNVYEAYEAGKKDQAGASYSRITDHSQLEVGRHYWVRSKEFNKFSCEKCYDYWTNEDNLLFSAFEIFGPIPEPIISGIE